MSDGIVYTYRGSWCAEGLNTTWECDLAHHRHEGQRAWDGATGYRAQVVAETRRVLLADGATSTLPDYDLGRGIGGHGGVIRDFVRCVQTGALPETVCTDNIQSLAMVFGAIESAEAGRRVHIGR